MSKKSTANYSTNSATTPADRLAFISFRVNGNFFPKLRVPAGQLMIRYRGSDSIVFPVLPPENFYFIDLGNLGLFKAPNDEGELFLGIAAKQMLYGTFFDEPIDVLLKIAYRPSLTDMIRIMGLFK